MDTVENADLLRIARQLRRFTGRSSRAGSAISQAMLSRFENQLAGLTDDVLDRASSSLRPSAIILYAT